MSTRWAGLYLQPESLQATPANGRKSYAGNLQYMTGSDW